MTKRDDYRLAPLIVTDQLALLTQREVLTKRRANRSYDRKTKWEGIENINNLLKLAPLPSGGVYHDAATILR